MFIISFGFFSWGSIAARAEECLSYWGQSDKDIQGCKVHNKKNICVEERMCQWEFCESIKIEDDKVCLYIQTSQACKLNKLCRINQVPINYGVPFSDKFTKEKILEKADGSCVASNAQFQYFCNRLKDCANSSYCEWKEKEKKVVPSKDDTKDSKSPDDTKSEPLKNLQGSAKELNQLNLNSAPQVIGRAITLLTAFMGSIALVLYMYAGFLWMFSRGNAEKVDEAKRIFIWTSLGVIAMLGAYVVVSTVFGKLGF